MVGLIIFIKLMGALVSSYTNVGRKMLKNDATIMRKKDDATFKDRVNSKRLSISVMYPEIAF